jgi:serine/threonine protein kinase
MEVRIGGKFKICKKLGNGAFGILYQGINTKTNEEVAIKLEPAHAENPMLQYEARLYEKL